MFIITKRPAKGRMEEGSPEAEHYAFASILYTFSIDFMHLGSDGHHWEIHKEYYTYRFCILFNLHVHTQHKDYAISSH